MGRMRRRATKYTLILVADVPPAEDEQLRLASLAGAPRAAFDLVERARALGASTIRFRVADGAPLLEDVRHLYVDAGYDIPEFAMHIMARAIDESHPVPNVAPDEVVLEDLPQAVIRPPR